MSPLPSIHNVLVDVAGGRVPGERLLGGHAAATQGLRVQPLRSRTAPQGRNIFTYTTTKISHKYLYLLTQFLVRQLCFHVLSITMDVRHLCKRSGAIYALWNRVNTMRMYSYSTPNRHILKFVLKPYKLMKFEDKCCPPVSPHL
jgi:hypothetical protein